MRNDDDGHDYLLIYISKAGRGCNRKKYSYRHSRYQLPQASPGTFFVMFGDAGKRIITTVGVLFVMLATCGRSIRPLPQVVGFVGFVMLVNRHDCSWSRYRADWRCSMMMLSIITDER